MGENKVNSNLELEVSKWEKKRWSIKVVKNCPCAADTEMPRILIPPEIYKLILYIGEKVKPNEWSGVLTAKWQDGDLLVTDLHIPKQIVSRTSAEVEGIPTSDSEDEILGFIHAHPFSSGKPTFSGIDEENAIKQLPFNVLVSGTGEMVGAVRIKLPCGVYTWMDTDVEIYYPAEIDTEHWDRIINENIEEKKVVTRSQAARSSKSKKSKHRSESKGKAGDSFRPEDAQINLITAGDIVGILMDGEPVRDYALEEEIKELAAFYGVTIDYVELVDLSRGVIRDIYGQRWWFDLDTETIFPLEEVDAYDS